MNESVVILVVDNDVTNQNAAVRLLNNAGYQTIAAGDGLAALNMVREHRPALTLLDVDMPGMNGIEVCRQIKTDPKLTGCYVVLLSGVAIDEQSRVEGLDGGADGYIIRPVTNNELLARVRGILRLQQAEQGLRESEKRLREVLENSLDASYKRNLKTNKYEYFSPVFARLAGYTPDEMKNLPLDAALGLMHPGDVTAINRAMSEAMFGAAGESFQVEYRFRHKNGEYRWFQDRFIVMRDENGMPEALIGSVSDMTERKQAQDELHESKWRLESIIEGTHVGTWEWNVQTGETIFNETWAQIVGYSLAELAPVNIKTWDMLAHPDDVELSNQMLELHFSGVRPHYEMETRMKHKDGHWVWVNDRGRLITRTGDGKPLMMFGTHADISERKRTEFEREALMEIMQGLTTTHELRDYLKLVHTAVGRVIHTENFFVILQNPETGLFEEIYSVDQFDPPAAPSLLENSISAYVFRTGEPLLLNEPHFEGLDDQGQMTLVGSNSQSWLGVPLRASSKIIGVMAVQDYETPNRYTEKDKDFMISTARHVGLAVERKQSEQALIKAHDLLEQRVVERTAELRSANLALEKAARMKDEFMASMSHELRTPLTGILGLSEVMLLPGYGQLTEKQRSSLERINGSGQHLLDLINGILDLSKLDSGKIELVPGMCEMERICQTCMRAVQAAAEVKQLRWSIEVKPETLQVKADPQRLKQMLGHLLSNAVKFTPEEGSFGIEVESRPAENLVDITVWDTGIGIPPEDFPRLFQPFVQLDARLARQYGGTGLGLALVNRLTALHGGVVTVKSTPGQGSRFTITLPLK